MARVGDSLEEPPASASNGNTGTGNTGNGSTGNGAGSGSKAVAAAKAEEAASEVK